MAESVQGQTLERLQRAPVITQILSSPDGEQTLKLIKATVAPGCSDAEVGHFLELCSMYGLDPFAREAWCAKGKGDNGKLLIMVGRDGLRKIVQRNGCEMEADVVHEKDEFAYTRMLEGGHPYHRVIHTVTGFERGPILGAWARVYERATGIERGFFVAPIGEYKPANASAYSPWSKQESVMVLGAAERQAARQATPLGGLLLAGEDESAFAARTVGAGEGSGEDPGWGDTDPALVFLVEGLMVRADELGHAGFGTGARGAIQMRLVGASVEAVEAWLEDAETVLDGLEPVEAVVVEPDEGSEGEQAALDVDGES